MLQDIPSDVQHGVNALLEHKCRAQLLNFNYSGGGCINHGGRLTTSAGDFFLKWNDRNKFPSMFESEARGLLLLRDPRVIDVPEVIGFGEKGYFQFLILTYVDQGAPSKQYWENLGNRLACLHQSTDISFGLDHNNYIGSLRQFNDWGSSWINFFIEQRLRIQLNLAMDSHLIDAGMVRKFELLYKILPSILTEEKPSLLHGDLWSGNLLINSFGEPCLIDPAVYYGHREMDLALTKLFGGFDNAFYHAYSEAFPLPPGFDQRSDLYNLYPLLVHVNLFGRSYVERIRAILEAFL